MFRRSNNSSSHTIWWKTRQQQDPKELAKKWKRNLDSEMRKIDRDIIKIKVSEKKAIAECRNLVKKNRHDACKILAKEIVSTRNTIERMKTAKVQLNSIKLNLQQSMAIIKVSNCIEKSAAIMSSMNEVINIREVADTMRTMAKEMETAGLVDEMIGDAMAAMDEEGSEDVADKEAEAVIAEITREKLSAADRAPSTPLRQHSGAASTSSVLANDDQGKSDKTWWGGEKPKEPYELAKEWKRNLNKEMRKIDRDISNIKRAEQRSVKECKALAKKGRHSACKILAKEIVNTRKTVERMYMTKAQLNSVQSNLQTSMAVIKMKGCMEKSAEVLTSMNKVINVREVADTMRTMAREMEKAGLVEEIVGDTMDSMEMEGVDEAAEEEVNKVMEELTGSVLAPAGSAPAQAVPPQKSATQEATAEGAEEGQVTTDDIIARLQAL